MDNQKEHLDYLFRSLQHHPSPYLIYELDGSLKWSNLAARYIFRMDNLKDLSIKNIDQASIANGVNKDPIAQSYETPIEIQLRDITFFIRTRVHLIPIEKSEGFFLIEILCPSREGLEALKQTISCIEFDRIDLAYQKQVDLNTGEITGIEALLRMRDEKGEVIPNDLLIHQIEGESLFSLVVLASLTKLSEFLEAKNSLGLEKATIYLNVSAHTVMHPEFCNVFLDYVDRMNLKPNEFGLEVTETAELSNTETADKSLKTLKEKRIKIALDDFGAGYSSLRYLKDLPVDVVKLDKLFTSGVDDPTTGRLISFVIEVCKALNLEMIGEGIENEEQKKAMMDIGCKIGQGFLMHKPEFLETFKTKINSDD